MWLLDRIQCYFGRHGGRLIRCNSLSIQNGIQRHFIHFSCDICGKAFVEEMGISKSKPAAEKPGLKVFKA